ncbi:hypothetical protein COSHB9_04260 [Companilactobacillus alimentarius]|uniref:DUF4926 domain-containing protein n=1 Tax=Companilactobacillus alimentarius DSM 20249 TaxID=1423720 RepID=A0A2K9HIC8_9LACO|nr:hypothetical protein [Companilactobacillus alimentarius]AUI71536.1 hypothetical protein LA20249_04740 [Companilactobacillus alimentarius DSM 20249]KRK74552.1 hypothetical protein FC67_GL001964 [Companilactobacillus alimentarius DSM 20249]MDT6953487.1 hypothetical protein [Companilactobacillus alimentarius]GEO44543.1 hypothetical protein LAL01_07750 [Companilactobacillus alimentarius]
MNIKLLPEYTWVKTNKGITGTILEVFAGKKPAYLVEYYPLSQVSEDDDESFFVDPKDIVDYKLPRYLNRK